MGCRSSQAPAIGHMSVHSSKFCPLSPMPCVSSMTIMNSAEAGESMRMGGDRDRSSMISLLPMNGHMLLSWPT